MALVISLALSGLKLKNTTESPALIFPIDPSGPSITVGTINSSFTSAAYDALTQSDADLALGPWPSTMAW